MAPTLSERIVDFTLLFGTFASKAAVALIFY